MILDSFFKTVCGVLCLLFGCVTLCVTLCVCACKSLSVCKCVCVHVCAHALMCVCLLEALPFENCLLAGGIFEIIMTDAFLCVCVAFFSSLFCCI